MGERLNIQGLDIGYKTATSSTKVVEKLSFEVAAGEIVSIIGRNGSGKTTLLKTIAQLTAALKGSITFGKTSLIELSPKKRARLLSYVGSVPQIPSLLKVKDLLAINRNPYTNWLGKMEKFDRAVIEQISQQLDLEDWLEKPLAKLSEGQKQRCFIAAALTQDTPILLMDEPSAFLDLDHKAKIFKLLKEIAHQENKIVILSTHDLNPALQISDQVMLLHQQKGIYGRPKDLVEQRVFENIFQQKWVGFDPDSMEFSICV